MIIAKTLEEIELMRESALIVSRTLGEVAKAITWCNYFAIR